VCIGIFQEMKNCLTVSVAVPVETASSAAAKSDAKNTLPTQNEDSPAMTATIRVFRRMKQTTVQTTPTAREAQRKRL